MNLYSNKGFITILKGAVKTEKKNESKIKIIIYFTFIL